MIRTRAPRRMYLDKYIRRGALVSLREQNFKTIKKYIL